jgi:hypothetical protein
MDSQRKITRADVRPPRKTFARRALFAPLRLVMRTALRMLFTSLVFLVCAALTMRLLGYDVYLPERLGDYFEGVGRLADILS